MDTINAVFLMRNRPFICFTSDRITYIVKALVIDEAINLVSAGELGAGAMFMLPHTPFEVIGYACVEAFGMVRD
jgi:hypothetical protein